MLAGWHNKIMMYSAGDLGIEIDYGRNQPGAILQRKEQGRWKDYLANGKPVVIPFDVEMLPPGRYCLREK